MNQKKCLKNNNKFKVKVCNKIFNFTIFKINIHRNFSETINAYSILPVAHISQLYHIQVSVEYQ